MQIYRFSLIFHSISELNKEKLPDFTKNFTDVGRRIGKSRNKLLFTLPFLCIDNCAEIMNFIMRTHPLHFTSSSTSFHEFIYFIELTHTAAVAEGDDWVSWKSRMQWLMESNALAEGVECDNWRSRMRWLKESNAVTGGDECGDRKSRIRWPKETNAMAGGGGTWTFESFFFTRYPTEIITSRL